MIHVSGISFRCIYVPFFVAFLLGLGKSMTTPANGAASLNDLGIQQLVEVKEKHFGVRSGYRFEILARSNPFYLERPERNGEDAATVPIMSNRLYVLGEAGNYGMGMGVMRHTAGLVYTRTNFLAGPPLDRFDHATQTFFLDNTYLRTGNWALGAGIRGTRIVNTADGEKDYSGRTPNVSIGKLFQPGTRQSLWVRWRSSLTFSEVYIEPNSESTDTKLIKTFWPEDRLNHWSSGLGLTHGWAFSKNWTLDSRGSFDLSRYSKGANEDRNDTLLVLGTAIQWDFLRYFSMAGFLDYSHRFSNLDKYSFSNWDGGVRLNADIGF
jgi:hypothetical protein